MSAAKVRVSLSTDMAELSPEVLRSSGLRQAVSLYRDADKRMQSAVLLAVNTTAAVEAAGVCGAMADEDKTTLARISVATDEGRAKLEAAIYAILAADRVVDWDTYARLWGVNKGTVSAWRTLAGAVAAGITPESQPQLWTVLSSKNKAASGVVRKVLRPSKPAGAGADWTPPVPTVSQVRKAAEQVWDFKAGKAITNREVGGEADQTEQTDDTPASAVNTALATLRAALERAISEDAKNGEAILAGIADRVAGIAAEIVAAHAASGEDSGEEDSGEVAESA